MGSTFKRVFLFIMFLSATAIGESRHDLEEKIRTVATVGGLDPDLAVAIATVESGLNPNAVGGMGEIGLFQLRPEYHKVFKGKPNHNILIAVAYLVELQSRFKTKHGEAWFVAFNYGPGNMPKNPKKTAYYSKVMKELGRIRFNKYIALN